MHRGEVLLGERLGRRHQRRLRAVLDGPQHRVQGNDGLATADLPHQQPLHRLLSFEVFSDRGDRLALIAGRLERQSMLKPARAQARRLVQRQSLSLRRPPAAADQENQLAEQQLLESKSLARKLSLSPRALEVHRAERRRPCGQTLSDAHAGAERLDDVGKILAMLAYERQDLGGADALRRRIVGDRAGLTGGDLRADRMMGDAKAPATDRPCRAAPSACQADSDWQARAG